jgi:hypothetical protein
MIEVSGSRHPALRMAPAPSSRRQCPRERAAHAAPARVCGSRVPGLVFSASPNDIAHPLLSCPPAKQRSCHDAAKACSACELGPVTRGVSSRRWAAGKRPCRVSGSPVREAWGRPGAGGDHHQVPLTGADREGSGVGLFKHAQHVGHLLAVTRSWPPADHHPLADIGRGEPDYQPVPHAGQLLPGGPGLPGSRAPAHR